jgi:putative membrane protein
MALSDLPFPEINASLNFCAAVLLATGYALIKSGRRDAHKKVMATALVVSTVFLASYLISKGVAGRVETKYAGDGFLKYVYYLILATHVPLAASLLYLVPWAVLPAIRGEYEVHRRRARLLFPVWMYVSVTGVLVYAFLKYSGSFAAGQSNLPALH